MTVCSITPSEACRPSGTARCNYHDATAYIRCALCVVDEGARLEALSDEISHVAGNLSVQLKRSELPASLQELHAAYGPYRRYVGIAAALAPLLVTIAYTRMRIHRGELGRKARSYNARRVSMCR